MIAGDNLALCSLRQSRRNEESAVLAAKGLVNKDVVSLFDIATIFPLYLYPNGKLPGDDLFVREEPEEEKRCPSFTAAFIKDFCERLKVKFVREGLRRPSKREIGPGLIFNYAYAIFHSPGDRERYAEFLRTDFPRLPITGDYDLFRELAGFGGHLIDLHVLKNGNGRGPAFPIKGNNHLEEVRYQPPQSEGKDLQAGRVWINDQQYFRASLRKCGAFPSAATCPPSAG
jgi:hypothetical protein